MRMISRIMGCLLTFALLICWLPFCAPAAEAATYYHGYESLTDPVLKKVYVLMDDAIRAMEPTISLDEKWGVSSSDVERICRYIEADHPEYFWFEGGYSYQYQQTLQGKLLLSVTLRYQVFVDAAEVNTRDGRWELGHKRLNAVVDSMLQTVPNDLSDYEKAAYLYDLLARHLSYVYSENDQNIYGALVEGEAVCSGFAKAYQYMLRLCGIDAWSVAGDSVNSSGQKERHRWTVLWLDGECYYADLTWDEEDDRLYHSYFLLSGKEMGRNHFMDEVYASVLPECDHNNWNYYERNTGEHSGVGILRDDMSGADLAEFFLPVDCYGSELTFEAVFHYDGQNFEKWFTSDTHSMLAKALGLRSASSKWYYLNNEYHFVITGAKKTHSIIRPEEISLNTTGVFLYYIGQKLPLIAQVLPANASYRICQFISSDPNVVSVDAQTGILTATGEGTASITVMTKENVTAVCQVTDSLTHDHSHEDNLTPISGNAGDCFTSGIKAHFHCELCGRAYFDSKGIQEVKDRDDLLIPAPGEHSFQWTWDDTAHWLHCAGINCDQVADDSRGDHVDNDQNDICDVCSYNPKSEPQMPDLRPDHTQSITDALIKVGIGITILVLTFVLARKKKR